MKYYPAGVGIAVHLPPFYVQVYESDEWITICLTSVLFLLVIQHYIQKWRLNIICHELTHTNQAEDNFVFRESYELRFANHCNIDKFDGLVYVNNIVCYH